MNPFALVFDPLWVIIHVLSISDNMSVNQSTENIVRSCVSTLPEVKSEAEKYTCLTVNWENVMTTIYIAKAKFKKYNKNTGK